MPLRIDTLLNNAPISSIGEYLNFSDQNSDTFEISGINLRFCTLERLGLKEGVFNGGNIKQSLLISIYGRKAEFNSVNFTGTHFKDCNFEKAKFKNCTFSYCSFTNCQLPHQDIIACLPKEPNLRKEIATNLKVNFNNLGKKDISDKFLDIEIKAEQMELWAIFIRNESYYRDKYNLVDQLKSLIKLFKIKTSAFVWGYGHNVISLIKSFCIIGLILALIIYLTKIEFNINSYGSYSLNLWDSIKLIFSELISFNSNQLFPNTAFGKFMLYFSHFIGTIYLGLLGATLYRRIAR